MIGLFMGAFSLCSAEALSRMVLANPKLQTLVARLYYWDRTQEAATIVMCAKVIRALWDHHDVRDVVLGRDHVNPSQSFVSAMRTECVHFRRTGILMMIHGINCCK